MEWMSIPIQPTRPRTTYKVRQESVSLEVECNVRRQDAMVWCEAIGGLGEWSLLSLPHKHEY